MAIPRGRLVDESESGIYHCVSRCVRQSFLLVNHTPPASPMDAPLLPDDHRRDWLLDRLAVLTDVFAIDCVSLAVMGNHLHLLLRTLPEVVDGWSDAEVAYRWRMLHPDLAMRRAEGIALELPPRHDEVRRLVLDGSRIAARRARLSSLSWFMKELKEWIARRANREEDRHGAFWEERFSSDRVLDEPGLLLCASYIDLNPVAARMADDPLRARYTSVEAHARRLDERGRELWRRMAEAPDSRGRVDPASEIEAFVAQFDGTLFSPSMPSRREPHGVADEWELVQEGAAAIPEPAAQVGHVGHGEHVAYAEHGEPATPTVPSTLVTDPPPPLSIPMRRPRHPRRRPPAVALCAVGQGDYFRRLRVLTELARERGDAKREAKGGAARALRSARRGGRAGGAGDVGAGGDPRHGSHAIEMSLARPVDLAAISCMAVALTQETPRRAMELLHAMLEAPRSWGSAIGTPSSLAAHALRRGVRGVVMSLRPFEGGGPSGAGGGNRCDGNNRAVPPATRARGDPAAA